MSSGLRSGLGLRLGLEWRYTTHGSWCHVNTHHIKVLIDTHLDLFLAHAGEHGVVAIDRRRARDIDSLLYIEPHHLTGGLGVLQDVQLLGGELRVALRWWGEVVRLVGGGVGGRVLGEVVECPDPTSSPRPEPDSHPHPHSSQLTSRPSASLKAVSGVRISCEVQEMYCCLKR